MWAAFLQCILIACAFLNLECCIVIGEQVVGEEICAKIVK